MEMSSGLDYSSLEVLWPETPHTPHKLCYCPPFEGDQHLFSRCINTSSCDTHYSVRVNSNSVCFAGLQHELTSIPLSVYFTLLQPCGGGRCIIRSLLAQYRIVLGKYRETLTQNLPLNIDPFPAVLHFKPLKKDYLRTKWLVPIKVSFIRRFHCSYFAVISHSLMLYT